MEVENRKIVVREEEVTKLVEEYQSFGWVLKDKHDTNVGQDGVFVRMVSLEFDRDPETPCCSSLRKLNRLYDDLYKKPAAKRSKLPELILILAGGAALIAIAALLILLKDAPQALKTVLFLFTDIGVAAVLSGVAVILLNKSKEKADAANMQKNEKIRGEIIAAASAISHPENGEEEIEAEWEEESEEEPAPELIA